MHIRSWALAALVALTFIRVADAGPKDPAARGLDLFIHAPTSSPAGAVLPVQVRVFGFPTVDRPSPLPGATVEAAWDPESLGDQATKVPPPVSVTCDQGGRGHLDIAVPSGGNTLKLLVAARFAGHERTRVIEIKHSPRYALDLRVSDTRVVPGGTVSVWVLLRDHVTDRPAGNKSVDLALKEGSRVRFARRLTTDGAGTASAEVRAPFTENPELTWTLSARTAIGQGDEAEANSTLGVREETPQAPSLGARWVDAEVMPGSPAAFVLEVRDGAGQGVARLPLRYWVGQKGLATPKDDKAWLTASTEIRTDVDGNARVTVATPKTISPRGSSMTVVAKTTVEGHPLTATSTLDLAAPAPELELTPEFGVLVPGRPQRLFFHTTMNGKPIAAELVVDGHGLHARVRTNARGWGESVWRAPSGVGAQVPEEAATDCAGQVSATVHVRWLDTGLGNPPAKPFDRCLQVDRDAVAVVRPDVPVVKAGEQVMVRVLGGKGSASLVLDGTGRAPWHGAWLEDAARGGNVPLPATARGLWSLSASGLPLTGDKHVLGGGVLVLPTVLPRLVAKVAGQTQLAPAAKLTIAAVLDDGHGRPLRGSVGAVVFDKAGGTHPEQLLALDTRHALAASAGIAAQDADAFLDGDQAFVIERWAALAKVESTPAAPAFDPESGIKEKIDETFRHIVQSLEGAIFQASDDPEQLPDVRVRSTTGFALNPEMLTLVTDAMSEAPVTPGGEPWQLADLMAIDAQVRYDNVARRVTRLKLFKLLAAVRNYLFQSKLDRDEPGLRDPNALLRRMVRDEALETGALLDPWGHGMSFVRSSAPRIPFVSTVPGFRLVSAGPDGRFGTADDVTDPFQRVLASKTPYAEAVDEDRIVDARWDMVVGDATVEAWQNLLEELTGQKLGDNAENVLGGLGGGGIGEGYGAGGAGLQGRHATRALDPGSARWLPPVRTDEQGRVQLSVPLGDEETTWQVVLVAIPDDGLPATASVEATTSLPLSVRAHAGAVWTVGDEVQVALRVRNRTDKALPVTLRLTATGGARLVDARQTQQTLSVPARSAATTYARVAGSAAGTGILEATVTGGAHADHVRHTWSIKPAGEVFTATHAIWVEDRATVDVPAPTDTMPARGSGRLVLERGIEPALAAALDSLAPESWSSTRTYADAFEVFGRVHAWTVARGGDTHALAVRSRELARQASDQWDGHPPSDEHGERALSERARHWREIANPAQARPSAAHDLAKCPSLKSTAVPDALDWLELLPWSDRKAGHACWASLRAGTLNQLAKENDPLVLARALLVFADAPAPFQLAPALATRLLAAVPIRPDGTPVLPEHLADDRAARAIVLAALVRTAEWWPADHRALAGRLGSKLRGERDQHGGYGSAEATRRVVTALLRAESPAAPAAKVRYTELSAQGRTLGQGTVELAANGSQTVALSPTTTRVRIESSGPGLLARGERPLFRSFYRPAEPAQSPLFLDLTMPKSPTRNQLASLAVTARHETGRAAQVLVRIPLPPGAALAEKVPDTWQVQGAVYVRTKLQGDALPRTLEVPLRFTLAGRVTMPEATARITDDDVAPARAPARPLVVGAPSP